MLWNTTESSTIGIKALNEDEPETRPRRRRKTPLLSPGQWSAIKRVYKRF
jgi:hypothetical protein